MTTLITINGINFDSNNISNVKRKDGLSENYPFSIMITTKNEEKHPFNYKTEKERDDELYKILDILNPPAQQLPKLT